MSYGIRKSFAQSTHVSTDKNAKTVSSLVNPVKNMRMSDGEKHPTVKLPKVAVLIVEGLLPKDFVLLPTVETVNDGYGKFMYTRKIPGADKNNNIYRAACRIYGILHPECKGVGDIALAAEHKEEARWVHKTADPAPRSKGRRK